MFGSFLASKQNLMVLIFSGKWYFCSAGDCISNRFRQCVEKNLLEKNKFIWNWIKNDWNAEQVWRMLPQTNLSENSFAERDSSSQKQKQWLAKHSPQNPSSPKTTGAIVVFPHQSEVMKPRAVPTSSTPSQLLTRSRQNMIKVGNVSRTFLSRRSQTKL